MIECFVFIMGLLIGSFLNVCIYRIPRKESIITPPSHCPNCQERLKPWDLIPIFSFIFNGGKCRYCGQSISFRYILFEVMTGFIYLLIYWEFGLNLEAYLIYLLSSVLIVIAGIDAKHRIIPDVISLPGIILGIVAAIFSIHVSFLNGLMGSLIGGGLFLLIAILTKGGMGGGDVKLMGMLGAFLGVQDILLTTFIGSLIGSFYGFYLILSRKGGRKTAVPYGPFLALGAFISLLYGDELIQLYLHWRLG